MMGSPALPPCGVGQRTCATKEKKKKRFGNTGIASNVAILCTAVYTAVSNPPPFNITRVIFLLVRDIISCVLLF